MNVQQFLKASLIAGIFGVSAAASAVEIGPAPTKSSLESTRGPFTSSSFRVSRPSGYGAGTVYYPTNAPAQVGVIAIVPGFTAYQSSINWWGPRLASHGFVVVTIDTNSTLDQPASRSTQQLRALDQVVALGNDRSSPVYGKIDPSRTGVMGWSMGGGGSLISIENRPSIKAAAPQAPWNSSTNFSRITNPVLILSCENDSIAPVAQHSNPFYASMTRNTKQLLERNSGSHSCHNSSQAQVQLKGISWMKRFMDGDTRYTSFACTNPGSSLTFSDFRTANCS